MGNISLPVLLISIIATLIISAAVSALITYSVYKKKVEKQIGNAEDKAREILDEALKTAEAKKREGLLEVKEESIKAKNELDREIKDRRAEAQRYEKKEGSNFQVKRAKVAGTGTNFRINL